MLPSVYGLGSCRLVIPLKFLHRNGEIIFSNDDSCWYAHHSAECLQRLRWIAGEIEITPEDQKLVFDKDSCPSAPENGAVLPNAEGIGIFEVSTRMQRLLASGLVLHGTCVRKRAFTDWQPNVQTFEALARDIDLLAARFRGVILVCNIAYNPDFTAMEPARVALNDFLHQAVAGRDNLRVLDPNQIINAQDPHRDMTDNNHFSSAFIPRLAQNYLATIRSLSG